MKSTDALRPSVFECRIGGFLGCSYAVTQADERLVYEAFGAGYTPEREQAVMPTDNDWEGFWTALDEIGAWTWSGEFVNPDVLDGTSWSIHIERNGRALAATGRNAYPPSGTADSTAHSRFCAAVEGLLGGLAFR
jgi:hypothetical protein